MVASLFSSATAAAPDDVQPCLLEDHPHAPRSRRAFERNRFRLSGQTLAGPSPTLAFISPLSTRPGLLSCQTRRRPSVLPHARPAALFGHLSQVTKSHLCDGLAPTTDFTTARLATKHPHAAPPVQSASDPSVDSVSADPSAAGRDGSRAPAVVELRQGDETGLQLEAWKSVLTAVVNEFLRGACPTLPWVGFPPCPPDV
ncbi:hypothetical protein HDU96_010069 [Phlyctochytrium bullatum]|nr:hypothetical protein HDU96_010069 [Phlyctochytrium bullatum]